jgi:hypothetical protein
MAVGRVQGGDYGRLAAPASGTMYVRDHRVARALAIQRHIALFEALGLPVPEHLATLAIGLSPVADGDDVILVDSLTGKFIEDVDVVGAWQTAPDQ